MLCIDLQRGKYFSEILRRDPDRVLICCEIMNDNVEKRISISVEPLQKMQKGFKTVRHFKKIALIQILFHILPRRQLGKSLV